MGFPAFVLGVAGKGTVTMGKFVDLTGFRFERLSVVSEYGRQNGHVTWLCKCDCGSTTVVCGGDLRNGKTRSCGCLHNEMVAEITKSHEMANTRLYNIWNNMKQRCSNPNASGYQYYGERGIKVCAEWLDPDNFFQWAKESGYGNNLTIDRIDTNGNYEPTNCRWTDNVTQQNNRRNNCWLERDGEVHTKAEWARILNLSYDWLCESWEHKGFKKVKYEKKS